MYETIMDPNVNTTDYDNFIHRHKSKNNRRIHFVSWCIAAIVVLHSILTFDFLDVFYAIPIVLVGTFVGHFFF